MPLFIVIVTRDKPCIMVHLDCNKSSSSMVCISGAPFSECQHSGTPKKVAKSLEWGGFCSGGRGMMHLLFLL